MAIAIEINKEYHWNTEFEEIDFQVGYLKGMLESMAQPFILSSLLRSTTILA